MKKALIFGAVAVLVISFALGAMAKPPEEPTVIHECYIDQGCEDGVCWYLKCCHDYVQVDPDCKGNKCEWDWTDWVCVSLI